MNTDPIPSAEGNPAPGKKSLDERLFLGVVVFGAFLILGVAAFLLWQRRGESTPSAANLKNQAPPARQLIEFTLTDRTGRFVKRADVDNQFLVVNFIFTGCTLGDLHGTDYMAQLQQKLTNHGDVRLISFTIDPGSDTPQTLAKFAQRFGADTNKWFFLTGDRKAVYSLIEQSFLGPPSKSLIRTTPGGFPNTDCIFLVDKQGVLREKFPAAKPTVVDQVLQSIQARRDSGS